MKKWKMNTNCNRGSDKHYLVLWSDFRLKLSLVNNLANLHMLFTSFNVVKSDPPKNHKIYLRITMFLFWVFAMKPKISNPKLHHSNLKMLVANFSTITIQIFIYLEK